MAALLFHLHLAVLLLTSVLDQSVGKPFPDWLITDINVPTRLDKFPDGTISLTNGIIRRDFVANGYFTTVDFYSNEKQSSLLRAISPEAVVKLDGIEYEVGGVISTIPRAYLNRTALEHGLKLDPKQFQFLSYAERHPEAPYPYTPKRGAPKDIVWPPKGLRLDVSFRAPETAPELHRSVVVVVHYEMYDGMPAMAKWVTVEARSPSTRQHVKVSLVAVETLALNWQWSSQGYDWFDVTTNWPHGTAVSWTKDPEEEKLPGSFEPMVTASFAPLPTISFPESGQIESFHVHEILIGSSDVDRKSFAKHRLLKTLAPQTLETPLYFHTVDSSSAAVRHLVDQLSSVGFDMLVYSFGSGFKLESTDKTYKAKIARDVAYARARGIEVGAYDLIAWDRKVKPEWKAITGSHYRGACFASGWYDYLEKHVFSFINDTGLMAVTTDGPYPGYMCSSTNHSHHHGPQDSVYWQTLLQGKFYTKLRTMGIYIHQPDMYFYQGGNRRNIGYNEKQYSLPRWQDLSISRQGLFDDTFRYPPSAGWMFLPMTVYHGGGPPAAFQPVSQHKTEFDWALAQHFGAGVGLVMRGSELYDSNETKAIVSGWVQFYKKYRDILSSDLIHVRRADMQGIDSFLHVNPRLATKGLAMVFNPTHSVQAANLTLPLYYTGLTDVARVSERGTPSPVIFRLERDYTIEIYIKLQPISYTWFAIS